MKQLIIGLATVSLWASSGLAQADSITVSEIQDAGTDFYSGVLTGAVGAWMASGIVRCERVSGALIGEILSAHPEWSTEPFEIAVAMAMKSTGCTFDWGPERKKNEIKSPPISTDALKVPAELA